MLTCINLQQDFGPRYRITWDPAYDPTHVPIGKRDPWMMQILGAGRGVIIFPYGSKLLGA